MQEKLKQRLLGAMVLVSLAIIFLPSLFQRDSRLTPDTTTEILPAPLVEPVLVAPPLKPDAMPPGPEVFQPGMPGQAEDPRQHPKPTQPRPLPGAQAKPPQPGLTQSGVPLAWVVQVGSFKSTASAATLVGKLRQAGFKAYSKPINTAKGEFTRVFVGPVIDQRDALQIKRQINQDYKLDSRILRFNPSSGN